MNYTYKSLNQTPKSVFSKDIEIRNTYNYYKFCSETTESQNSTTSAWSRAGWCERKQSQNILMFYPRICLARLKTTIRNLSQ